MVMADRTEISTVEGPPSWLGRLGRLRKHHRAGFLVAQAILAVSVTIGVTNRPCETESLSPRPLTPHGCRYQILCDPMQAASFSHFFFHFSVLFIIYCQVFLERIKDLKRSVNIPIFFEKSQKELTKVFSVELLESASAFDQNILAC